MLGRLKSYLADEIAKLGEQALNRHIMSQDAAHFGEKSTNSINIADCAMVTL